MSQFPNRNRNLLEYIKGLSVWAKVVWVIVLGYIVGRIVYWISRL
ncbi:hypothetical protein [Brevibacillus fulvus]|uniref:Uncharacterized protein n=1 Tax=Brevibacillus fulvus TaxID=1125967 RepID=A0A938Y0K2_9BACL|nr:hypothetical protein [Brevibacillus fulvus]MBM7591699.1 hypothetical protein [Brevibacillus fulvus]